MKSFVRTFLLAGILGGLWGALYFGWGKELSYAIWSGVITGILFGLVSAFADRYRENRVAAAGPALTDELLLHATRATHEGLSGWLYLTNRRVLFEGYASEADSPEVTTLFDRFPNDADDPHHLSIPVLRVADVLPSLRGVLPGIDIVLDDGRELYFATEDPVEWADEITATRQKYLDEPRSEDKKLFP